MRVRYLFPLSWEYRGICVWLDVTFWPATVWVYAMAGYVAGRLLRRVRPAVSVRLLSQAQFVVQRIWRPGRAAGWLERGIAEALAEACRHPDLFQLRPPTAAAFRAARQAGIVLKAPRLQAGEVVEKGVLLLKYSEPIVAFHQSVNMAALLGHYQLVLEPSWTGYANLGFLAFTRYRNHPIVMLSPFRGDRRFLERLNTNLTPIELGPGDWVDPHVFTPLAGEPKLYDVVMVARWNWMKRHDLLLDALRRIGDPGFRVALVAANISQDSDRQRILAAIEVSGLRRQIEIFEDIPADEVNRVLNQSKVNLLLSRQEGGNRALFEGFFAGVPGLALRHHIGIRTEHFLPETGRLIDRDELAPALLYFREHWREFNPRQWALWHISPEHSTRRLNEFLIQHAQRRGECWTRDIVMKCNKPGLQYYPDDSAAQGLPAMDEILEQFPVALDGRRG